MHIPDGFLSPPVFISFWAAAVCGLSYALKKVKETLKERMIPLMAVMAAFIFAGQMLNFPVMAGTSGHLCGGVLAAILLGPYAGAIVLTCVLIVQCLIFQDGGVTALGANIFNMAFLGSSGGYLVYSLARKLLGRKRMMAALALAAWFSVVAAASACALELAMSGTMAFKAVLLAMAGVHAVIGIGEAIITCLVAGFILKLRPDLFYGTDKDE